MSLPPQFLPFLIPQAQVIEAAQQCASLPADNEELALGLEGGRAVEPRAGPGDEILVGNFHETRKAPADGVGSRFRSLRLGCQGMD